MLNFGASKPRVKRGPPPDPRLGNKHEYLIYLNISKDTEFMEIML